MSTEKKCPKCGAEVAYTDMIYKTVFLCASKIAHSGYFYQGKDCELATLRTALEKAKEGFRMYANHDESCDRIANGIDGDCRCGFNGVLSTLTRDNGDL